MVHPWHDLPNPDSEVADSFNVVIEIPKHSKLKYELDKPTGMLRVDRVLHSSVHYPANYGFLPRTFADDQDPLDALVLGDSPVQPLAILRARAIGVMHMLDEGALDDKIIAVHVDDPAFADYSDVGELPRHVAREIARFFEDYKVLENKTVKVDEMEGREGAIRVVKEAVQMYHREENRLRGWK
ncbi:MAG TPA: inorganic diphosphatase [Polyangiaceae bacterium LLY-WYZ-14_1]|nr:inorganic diphosphatase [Polyangiaceae bacterium LLY-WYZ-14_1]